MSLASEALGASASKTRWLVLQVRGKDGVGAKMDHMELEREKGVAPTGCVTK
jgi:hypothetical protein